MKLKPCPFCGDKKPRLIKHMSCDAKVVVGHMVVCEPEDYPCGAQGPIFGSKARAIKGWQRRAK